MYDTERLKHLIGEASFDGWVENGGSNCDGFEEHVQLLKESRANEIVDECLKDLLRSSPELSPQTLRWLKRWFNFDPDKAKFEIALGKNPKLLDVPKAIPEDKQP